MNILRHQRIVWPYTRNFGLGYKVYTRTRTLGELLLLCEFGPFSCVTTVLGIGQGQKDCLFLKSFLGLLWDGCLVD